MQRMNPKGREVPTNDESLHQPNIISENTDSNSNSHNLRRKRNQRIIIDEHFDLNDFSSDLDDSDTSEYVPTDSDSDVKACTSVKTSKKRKVGKINSVRESLQSDDDIEFDPVANRGPQPLVSSPVSKFNSTLTVSPEKAKYTKKSRNKPLNKHKWYTENKKAKRNSGKAYEYKVKGNKDLIRKVDARKIGPPCKCQNKCFEILGQEAVNKIFHEYWELGNYDLQTKDLQTKIEKEEIK